MNFPKGNPFGTHRVIEPAGVLPQPARKINNDMSQIFDNEILVDVETLNIDSASFTQIEKAAEGNIEQIKKTILGIVAERGKMQNPVTGSGGMFIGTVNKVGPALAGRDLKPGDKIASLVSLSLTPLKIHQIIDVKPDIDQVNVKAQAILFESGIYAKLPSDMPASLALAVLDVAGAPAQARRLVNTGDTVVIIGVGGKSGILCAYEARKKVGPNGKIIGIAPSAQSETRAQKMGLCDVVVRLDATDAIACYNKISELTHGKLADLVINCVNVENCEMASILMCKERGKIYFFSMATSFTKAALGAEGVGKDIDMILGNGYAKDHADIAINIMRESPELRKVYEELYA